MNPKFAIVSWDTVTWPICLRLQDWQDSFGKKEMNIFKKLRLSVVLEIFWKILNRPLAWLDT